MYNKLEGGTIINIQGLNCCIPKEGYVYNVITEKLEYSGIYSRSNIQEEQYWERLALPFWYKEVMKEWDEYDKNKKDDDVDFYDERLEEFKKQEWDRRLNGFWFMNNGKPCYIVGIHYFYLQWWSIDIGYPKFRIPDLEKAYFLQYCIEDPLCMGMVEVTKRRFGKSFWAGVFVTEYTTRTKMTNGGIQSKTGSDAKKFFSKTVVNPFRRLPKFFRPEYDESLGSNPKSEIRFQKTNVRGKKSNSNLSKDELGSVIDWQSADKVAYDGQKIHRYVADEIGKTNETDVYERHEVVRYCLLDDEGKIIGKALYTTTVEKIEGDKGGIQDAFKTLWDESNQNNLAENGTTRSGLYRFFMSAKRTRNFDPFGYPDEEKTLKAILSDREGVKNNPRSLSARIRKEPLTIDEAFSIDADKCVFNANNLQERIKQLEEEPKILRNVVFYRDEINQVVKWRDANSKEKHFCWQVSEDCPLPSLDKIKYNKEPTNIKLGAIAVDSYSNSQGGRKYGSKASAWIGLRLDINNPNKTLKAVGHLYGRPNTKDELHLQVMLAAECLGFKAWYEHVSDDYFTYFKDRGKLSFLGKYPISTIKPEDRGKTERHYGFPTTPFSLTKQLDTGISYFEHYSDRIDFLILLNFSKDFDPYNRTEYDCVVAFLMLLVILTEPIIDSPPRKESLVKEYGTAMGV